MTVPVTFLVVATFVGAFAAESPKRGARAK
jgi:hypothetical protein